MFSVCLLGVNYQDIGFNGAGLSGGAVSSVGGVGGEQLGGLLAPVSVQNLAALAAMTQPPVVTQAAPIAPAAATAAPQPTAPPLCKCASSDLRLCWINLYQYEISLVIGILLTT